MGEWLSFTLGACVRDTVVILCMSMNVYYMYMYVCLLAYTVLDLIQHVNFENARFLVKVVNHSVMRIRKMLIFCIKVDHALYYM